MPFIAHEGDARQFTAKVQDLLRIEETRQTVLSMASRLDHVPLLISDLHLAGSSALAQCGKELFLIETGDESHEPETFGVVRKQMIVAVGERLNTLESRSIGCMTGL